MEQAHIFIGNTPSPGNIRTANGQLHSMIKCGFTRQNFNQPGCDKKIWNNPGTGVAIFLSRTYAHLN
ncbi:MAG: hypothetical protein CM1200mP4_1350 [Rhodospirillaceae bacterium]|nr:MAG: hypothetical protein CM1200mP4_1350 [Rhodospirillaceae bacterium]